MGKVDGDDVDEETSRALAAASKEPINSDSLREVKGLSSQLDMIQRRVVGLPPEAGKAMCPVILPMPMTRPILRGPCHQRPRREASFLVTPESVRVDVRYTQLRSMQM